STHTCPVCQGTGIVRSTESLALMVMRQVEDHVLRKPGFSVNVKVPTDVALYILNAKRHTLSQLEAKYGLSITVVADDHLVGSHFAIEKGEPRAGVVPVEAPAHVRVDSAEMQEVEEDDSDAEETEDVAEAAESNGHAEGEGGRRGDRAERSDSQEQRVAAVNGADTDEDDTEGEASDEAEPREVHANGEAHSEGDGARRRRRRGRRGCRRNRREDEFGVNGNGEAHEANGAELAAIPESTGIAEAPVAAEAAPAPEVAEVAIAAAAPVTPEVVAAA